MTQYFRRNVNFILEVQQDGDRPAESHADKQGDKYSRPAYVRKYCLNFILFFNLRTKMEAVVNLFIVSKQ